ncbi:hypothetical protein EON65_06335 [archaeon]|nr:MAG: hypothetical protein EON65_06335 [archaeon]
MQSFHQFPTPELKWNLVDNVIVGGDSFDGSLDNIKTRRLRYMVIPHNICTNKDIEAYYEQIEMLLDHFRKNLTKDAKIEVTKDTSLSVNDFVQLEKAFGCISLNRFSSVYRQCQRGYSTARLYMRGPKHANPNWLFFKYERNLYSCKAFHFEMHWTVCDSWLIDEYINLLFRRCSKWGLRVVQTPEYFTTSNLSIHPFKALPYIQLPESIHRVPNSHSSALRVVERLVFGRSQGWIFDSEQTTDWSNIGLAPPNYSDRDRDFAFELESSAASDAVTPNSNYVVPTPTQGVFSALTRTLRMVFKKSDEDPGILSMSADSPSPDIYPTSTNSPALGGNGLFGMKNSNVKLDRQYVHVTGLAVVRMAANGFIWFHNATARVTEGLTLNTLSPTTTPADVSSYCPYRCETSVVVPPSGMVRPLLILQAANMQPGSIDERRTQTLTMMRSLEHYVNIIIDCHELVMDMVNMAIGLCEEKAAAEVMAKEGGPDSVSSLKANLLLKTASKEDIDIPPAPLSNRAFSSETNLTSIPSPTLLLPSASSQNLNSPEGMSPRKGTSDRSSDRLVKSHL